MSSTHIKAFERRILYLETLIEEAADKPMNYAKAELSAIRWALKEI